MTAKLLPREEGQRRHARRQAEQEAVALIVRLAKLDGYNVGDHVLARAVVALAARLEAIGE